MKLSIWSRPLIVLGCLLAVVALDSWLLLSSFQKVLSQQAAVRKSYRNIDQIAVVTTRLRDAEMFARKYIASDENDRARLQNDYSSVEREMALVSAGDVDDVAALSLAKKFDEILEKRRSSLLTAKKPGEKLKSEAVTEAIEQGDEFYLELGSILAKLKDLRETTLKSDLAPASKFSALFYIATLITALLNVGVGYLSLQLAERVRKQSEAEKAEFERHSLELSEAAAANFALTGELEVADFAFATRQFFIEKFGAAAVKVYSVVNDRPVTVGEPNSYANDVPGSDLVSQARLQKTAMYFRDLPATYWQISSGFGSSQPKTLLLLPLNFQMKNIGVIEVAFFSELDSTAIERIQKLADIFAVSFNAAHTRQQTNELLEQTVQQAAELQAQQEELRTTNEELEQQARALESQQHAVNIKNKELENVHAQLEQKANDLTQSNKYKSEFLAKMSHELRTPLNGLLILSTLLIENKEKTLTAQQQQFARSINGAGNDLLTLINDILDLSKIEARKLAVHLTEFTVEELFASKRRTFQPQTDAKNLELVQKFSPEAGRLVLFTDRQRLDQVLRNFLSNAIKFTEKGSVTLEASFDDESKMVTFSVRDTGIGIPAAKQKLIFEAFEQSDVAVSSKYGGTGLGLTISKELALLLGGDISLSSRSGEGSTFSLTIPARFEKSSSREIENATALGAGAANPARELREVMPAGPSDLPAESLQIVRDIKQMVAKLDKQKRAILIVEDDEAFRSAVAETVRASGFEALEVGDGSVAIEVLEFFVPDAILLDIKLPGISGLGILEIMKHSMRLRHVPVHMISGLEYQTNALRMGALGYLSKPVTIDKIESALERIENLLSRRLRRLLLIEDNKLQNEAISALFEGNDIEVVSANTGRAALEKVAEGSFDCIVLDLSLPDVSGFDLLAELRKIEISLPPIVIYTGKDLSTEEQNYLRKYSESIVIKGARSPDRLLDEVNLFLHRVESALPEEKRNLIPALRSHEQYFKDRTILLVDDDVRNIFSLTSALESKGFKVLAARDGVEALQALDEYSQIDIVLMDLMMPNMDGIEAMKRIRKNVEKRIRDIPIVALTAKAMKEDHERCMDAGANDYLSKPINVSNLLSVLKVWLSNPGSQFFS